MLGDACFEYFEEPDHDVNYCSGYDDCCNVFSCYEVHDVWCIAGWIWMRLLF